MEVRPAASSTIEGQGARKAGVERTVDMDGHGGGVETDSGAAVARASADEAPCTEPPRANALVEVSI